MLSSILDPKIVTRSIFKLKTRAFFVVIHEAGADGPAFRVIHCRLRSWQIRWRHGRTNEYYLESKKEGRLSKRETGKGRASISAELR